MTSPIHFHYSFIPANNENWLKDKVTKGNKFVPNMLGLPDTRLHNKHTIKAIEMKAEIKTKLGKTSTWLHVA